MKNYSRINFLKFMGIELSFPLEKKARFELYFNRLAPSNLLNYSECFVSTRCEYGTNLY